ncbi:MAG: LptE family protein [Chlorobi bacterium]|nr:LptE family protein [Chlorobiota bacterium]
MPFSQNRAKLIYPDLSQSLTEGLREKLRRQTSLNEVNEGGDLEFSGYISNYEIRPTAIQKKDLAAQNRLTITINVKYINNKNHDLDFEKSFSGYEDYDTSASLDSVEEELVNIIIEKLTEDIFNATIADW